MRVVIPVKVRPCLLLISVLLTGVVAAADNASFAGEGASDARQAWADNLRWAIDVTAQEQLDLDADEQFEGYVAGLDLHKVISNGRRDIGTLILQPYFVWLPGDRGRPAFFDGNEATLTWRIANFNYVALPRGKLNVRVGHFEVPFGLEQDVDTNGTLRQYSNGENLGLKADWGVSINGRLPRVHYEIGLTRGTGQEYFDAGKPYAISARIGSPPDRNLIAGISAFRGRVAGAEGLAERRRIGTDVRWLSGPLEFMVEASVGKDGDDDTRSWLAEAAWSNRSNTGLLYLQQEQVDFETSRSRDLRASRIGVRWSLTNRWTIAAQIGRTVRWDAGRIDSNVGLFHVRYRR